MALRGFPILRASSNGLTVRYSSVGMPKIALPSREINRALY
jgi:hypothetical protein